MMSYIDRIQIIPNIICHIHFIFYDFWKHKEAITFGFWHWSPPRASIQSRNGDFNAIRSRFSMCLGMSLFCTAQYFGPFLRYYKRKKICERKFTVKRDVKLTKKGNLKSSFFFSFFLAADVFSGGRWSIFQERFIVATKRQIIFPLEGTIFHPNERLFSLLQKGWHFTDYRNGRLHF